jgi:hypothetical protein
MLLCRVVWWMFHGNDLMTEAANTSETSVNFYHNNRADSHLCTRRCEELKCNLYSLQVYFTNGNLTRVFTQYRRCHFRTIYRHRLHNWSNVWRSSVLFFCILESCDFNIGNLLPRSFGAHRVSEDVLHSFANTNLTYLHPNIINIHGLETKDCSLVHCLSCTCTFIEGSRTDFQVLTL